MISKVFPAFLIVLAASALSLPAQPPPEPPKTPADFFNQPPPGVEEGLLARAKLFYDCFVSGPVRKADEYVAEDSKDVFFEGRKDHFYSYRLTTPQFSENNTRAQLVTIANVDFKFQGRTIRVDVPMKSLWKLIDGQWFWYVLPPEEGKIKQTPFGPMDFRPKPTDPSGPVAPPMPVDKRTALMSMAMIPVLGKDKLKLSDVDEYADTVPVQNRSKRALKFHLESQPLDGLELSPFSGEVKPGGSVDIHASYKPSKMPVEMITQPMTVVFENGGRAQVIVMIYPHVKTAAKK